MNDLIRRSVSEIQFYREVRLKITLLLPDPYWNDQKIIVDQEGERGGRERRKGMVDK